MIWPAADLWRAPVGDFPPPWATAWGDDTFGLWADLVIGEATQRLRWIQPTGPGGFWMGSPRAERAALPDMKELRVYANHTEHEPRLVVVADGFWLSDTPCTQAFWSVVLPGDQPSGFEDGDDGLHMPVEQVSWDDVRRFLAELARQCPALVGRAALPTEVQWEYAARAGSRTAYPWGDLPDDSRANWGERHQGTTPVNLFPPNSFGLYDMHGNVFEWCADAWRRQLDVENPAREGGTGPLTRVVRGGSWATPPGFARSAFRFHWSQSERLRHLGFRLALRSTSPARAR